MWLVERDTIVELVPVLSLRMFDAPATIAQRAVQVYKGDAPDEAGGACFGIASYRRFSHKT